MGVKSSTHEDHSCLSVGFVNWPQSAIVLRTSFSWNCRIIQKKFPVYEYIAAQMKDRQRPSKKGSSDPFDSFKNATRQAFAFLKKPAYGFSEEEVVTHPPECVVRYRNRTTGVTVAYEWGGSPSVVITKLYHKPELAWHGEEVGLRFVVLERCPLLLDRFDQIDRQNLDKTLREYARVLKECGDELLHSNFAEFRKLIKLVRDQQRKANLEMFGSESGETIKRRS